VRRFVPQAGYADHGQPPDLHERCGSRPRSTSREEERFAPRRAPSMTSSSSFTGRRRGCRTRRGSGFARVAFACFYAVIFPGQSIGPETGWGGEPMCCDRFGVRRRPETRDPDRLPSVIGMAALPDRTQPHMPMTVHLIMPMKALCGSRRSARLFGSQPGGRLRCHHDAQPLTNNRPARRPAPPRSWGGLDVRRFARCVAVARGDSGGHRDRCCPVVERCPVPARPGRACGAGGVRRGDLCRAVAGPAGRSGHRVAANAGSGSRTPTSRARRSGSAEKLLAGCRAGRPPSDA
jgi:hypothetical protein